MNKHLYLYALALPALVCAATIPLEGHVLPPPAYSNQNLESVPLGTQGQEKSRFLMLDNLTYANIHDLLDDPFLVLRAQFPFANEENRILAAWEFSAKMNALEDYPDAIGKDLHPMDAMLDPSCYNNVNWAASPGMVLNHDPLFDNIKPVFSIDTGDLTPESILWKVTRICDGIPSDVVVQGLAAYSPQIELTELQATFLNSDGDYLFQFKAATTDNAWTEWSAPFEFKVIKPQGVSKPEFNKLSKGKYEISWKGSDDPEIRYLVFASNSLDFIPSIYFNKLVKSFAPDSPSTCVESQNLVAITQDSRITIDGSYAYYRIVAEKQGCRSVPSEIIYVYDNGLSQSRDVLTYDETSQTSFRYAMDAKGVTNSPHANTKSWVKSKYISDQDWEKAKPYLMPDNHPMKGRMDRIFKERVTKNAVSMKSAGFHQPEPRGLHRPVVSRHSVLPGYLVKLFLDNQKGMNDVHRLTRRAIGAESIAEAIKRLGYRDIFKVPKKWIYVLPDEPAPKNAADRKCFVLLVQDMNILPSRSNRRKWKSSEVNQQTLEALFTIFEDQGLADSVFAFNVPFDKDGYIAIIDTEVHHHWPVPYEKFLKWLNPSNQNYWKSLIKNKPHK